MSFAPFDLAILASFVSRFEVYTWGPLIPGDPSYLGTPCTWGLLVPGDPSYLGTPHTWELLIPGDPSYLETPHTWGPLIPGDPSFLGTPHTWGRSPGMRGPQGTSHTCGPIITGDPSFFSFLQGTLAFLATLAMQIGIFIDIGYFRKV